MHFGPLNIQNLLLFWQIVPVSQEVNTVLDINNIVLSEHLCMNAIFVAELYTEHVYN